MVEDLDDLIHDTPLQVVAHDLKLGADSRALAFLRFGKGRHPARLNCGDCASYALAKSSASRCCSRARDFARTDIVPALADTRLTIASRRDTLRQASGRKALAAKPLRHGDKGGIARCLR